MVQTFGNYVSPFLTTCSNEEPVFVSYEFHNIWITFI